MVIPNYKLAVAIIIISILIVGISEGIGSNNISASLSESRSKLCPPGYTIDESGYCGPTNVSPMRESKNETFSEHGSVQPEPTLEPQLQMQHFTASLTGDEEIPPINTIATGTAYFTLNEDGDEMSYNLEVEDIEGATNVHIHQGGENEIGHIVVWLYSVTESTDVIDGILTDGYFASEDFVGPLQGYSMSGLLDIIENGQAYVNVHTESNPGGELRGTIEQAPAVADDDEEEENNTAT